MTPRQKLRLRACRMLISYQKNGNFGFQSPRVERIFSGETGNLITQFIQHERAIGRSEKTIESREIYLRAFNLYLQRFDLSFNDLSVDCIEAFFKSMNYELAMRHNSDNHLRQLFHYLYDRGITVTDNLPSTGRMCAGYRQLNAPKPASNGIEQKPLPCSLCALALNTRHPRFVRTGGFCSSLWPESSGRGWVLWSFGFAGHAASGGRAMPSSSQVVSAKW